MGMNKASIRSMTNTTRRWMCRGLSEYLGGHDKALSIVRIASREEEARRGQGGMRDQLRRELRRMQAMGRSLLLQQRIAVSGRWWRGTSWMGIKKATPGVGARPVGEVEETDRAH